MADTVYGRLETTNRLIVDASALAIEFDIHSNAFTEAADAVARGELHEADGLLNALERRIDHRDVVRCIRDARQLVEALQEEWSE